jgi:hypothetical protein
MTPGQLAGWVADATRRFSSHGVNQAEFLALITEVVAQERAGWAARQAAEDLARTVTCRYCGVTAGLHCKTVSGYSLRGRRRYHAARMADALDAQVRALLTPNAQPGPS